MSSISTNSLIGSVLTVGVAMSTVLVLSLAAFIIIYYQHKKTSNILPPGGNRADCLQGVGQCQQQVTWLPPTREHFVVWTTYSHHITSQHDVTLTTATPPPSQRKSQVVLATVAKLTELFNRWLNQLVIGRYDVTVTSQTV
jgi:hypothetical protein